MATIVNNPPANTESGGGSGFLIGIILLIVVAVLFFYYGLPYLGNASSQGSQINVPGKIDVNINQPK